MGFSIKTNTKIDLEAYEQILEINEEYHNNNIVIMPDYHKGDNCVIGTTMKFRDRICPDFIGVDIGCGVTAYPISKDSLNKDILPELDKYIRENIPTGHNVHEEHNVLVDMGNWIANSYPELEMNERDRHSIGTLGGGNHFIEINEGKDNYYIVVHSGSRNLGKRWATHFHRKALKNDYKEEIRELINNTPPKLREKVLTEFRKTHRVNRKMPSLTGEDLQNYINIVDSLTDVAYLNRIGIICLILDHLGILPKTVSEMIYDVNFINCTHNYISDKDYNGDYILRKGAISAEYDRLLLIPLNMRDGVIIGAGKGVAHWNKSAPHGAGRLYSRTKAREYVDIDDFRNDMRDVFTTSVCDNTRDEAPNVYKPKEDILEVIKETVDIIEIAKPIYNFKDINGGDKIWK